MEGNHRKIMMEHTSRVAVPKEPSLATFAHLSEDQCLSLKPQFKIYEWSDGRVLDIGGWIEAVTYSTHLEIMEVR